MVAKQIAIAVTTTVITQQILLLLKEEGDRAAAGQAAETAAHDVGKPFLVVGGPWGGGPLRHLFGMQAHGCGDSCLDISAAACAGCNYVPGDIRDIPFSNKCFGAVLSSHVLEHLPNAQDCQQAWRELHRVADQVFICLPSKWSIISYLVPDHYLFVKQVDTETLLVEERAPPRGAYLVTAH